jgi:enoyl-CoA hydratase
MKTEIKLTMEGEVATLHLVPPEGKPPTLDQDVLAKLGDVISELENAVPRLLIVRSRSSRFFCVGANIEVLKETNEETIVPWVKLGHEVLNRLEDLPCPVIAVVEGYAMGGGLELAMACDLIFAADSARFAQSEAGLGFIPGWGGCRRLAGRMGTAMAKYYFFSGRMLDAATARELGLIDMVAPVEELESELQAYASEVLKNSSYAVQTFKKLINNEELSARERNISAEAFNSVGCLKDPDTKQRLNEFLEQRNRKKK